MRPGDELDLLVLIVLALVVALIVVHVREVLSWTVEVLAGVALIVVGSLIAVLLLAKALLTGLQEGLASVAQLKHRGSRPARVGREDLLPPQDTPEN